MIQIEDYIHDYLPIIDSKLSLKDLAVYKDLGPVLHIKDIAYLYCFNFPDSEKKQKIITSLLRRLIEEQKIESLSIDDYVELIKEWEATRTPGKRKYRESKSQNESLNTIKGTLPSLSSSSSIYAHLSNDVIDDEYLLVVHRDEIKRWLKEKNEWPLPEDNLLANWWPDPVGEQPDSKNFIIEIEPGTNWQEVIFRLITKWDEIEILVNSQVHRTTFKKLGLTKKNQDGGVNACGELFEKYPEIIDDNLPVPNKMKKTVSNLRQKLREAFPEIKDDPLPYSNGYKPIFQIVKQDSYDN